MTKHKGPLQAIRELTPKKRIILYTILDLFFSWAVPIILIVIKYDIFLKYQEAGPQPTGIMYIFALMLIGALIWRGKVIVDLTHSNGLKFALMKSMTPFVFLLFYFFLNNAGAHIERLKFITLWSAVSHFIAIFFRYKAGEATKELIP